MALLQDTLLPYQDRYAPALRMDVARVYVVPSVLGACSKAGVHMLMVPALIAWLLQLLGTHVFHVYNAMRVEACQTEPRSSATGQLTVVAFLQCAYCAIHAVSRGAHAGDWVQTKPDTRT